MGLVVVRSPILTRIKAVTFPKTTACIKAPMSIITMEKIFSAFVLAETFPNPTLVRLDVVKYKAVT